ncbi:ADP-ribosylglycohydrolase family protein [Serratia ficaria]|uniref:ADP-ribosyl-[dinitrogen reductase] glycohydrolase n=1 Tax=Serratia ficaria TaxID=61651 RepID=A0A240BWT9_SERFI|nr:ADP-ribosylglycohydrolase family protein [Serratia ficaria]REF45123.1 ADP-ribosylglycohydrolase [Serratia ficaria]CAI0860977.1 ADP-ribosyl-[dinitrogen reductase] glycohydrolase [Serratia ficaria]CAI0912283.1 ADP-ribosyl-[dinitrogen reductase] glycohydrolase [Serratia ficaria]CAI0919771.1 ADP-ribosyl-[dinitrogen reductase] glycohydrolase [Serratia ficaria]CAI1504759.1 ADP-ribosyl-[dinitrogen reductase] glycohydrolase [Serratia ficaria]
MKQLTQEQRVVGALYGQMLGDALGMPSELWPRERVKRHFGWIDRFLDGPAENSAACYFKAGQYTDDTSMALALADALVEAEGQVVPELIARNVIRWVDSFDAFNKNILGPSSKLALGAQKQGTPIAELENNGVTNGAAMRVSPLGCVLPSAPLARFCRQTWLASSPTHKSDIAVAGAVVIAWAVSRAVEGASWEEIRLALPGVAEYAQRRQETTFSASLSARIELAFRVVDESIGTEQASERVYQLVGAGVSTIESVPAALAMVQLAQTDPTRCAVLCANLGGDTDTIGAMATAVCGALNGIDAFEPSLLAELKRVNPLDVSAYAPAFLRFRRRWQEAE